MVFIEKTKYYKTKGFTDQVRLERKEKKVISIILTLITLYYIFMFIWMKGENYTYTLMILNNLIKFFKHIKSQGGVIKEVEDQPTTFKKEFMKKCYLCRVVKDWLDKP